METKTVVCGEEKSEVCIHLVVSVLSTEVN